MDHPKSALASKRVLVVDDRPRARQSLRVLLEPWPRVAAVQEAANGLEALELMESHLPDVVIMDARMPVLDGLEATRLIKAKWPGVQVVVLSMFDDGAAAALEAGADAFASKLDLSQELRVIMATFGESGGSEV